MISLVCPLPECGAEMLSALMDEHLQLHQMEVGASQVFISILFYLWKSSGNTAEYEQWIKLRVCLSPEISLRIQQRYGFESKDANSTNYMEQFERSLEND